MAKKPPRKPRKPAEDFRLLVEVATRDMARNKALIEAGETYRSQKPSDFRRGSRHPQGRIS